MIVQDEVCTTECGWLKLVVECALHILMRCCGDDEREDESDDEVLSPGYGVP